MPSNHLILYIIIFLKWKKKINWSLNKVKIFSEWLLDLWQVSWIWPLQPHLSFQPLPLNSSHSNFWPLWLCTSFSPFSNAICSFHIHQELTLTWPLDALTKLLEPLTHHVTHNSQARLGLLCLIFIWLLATNTSYSCLRSHLLFIKFHLDSMTWFSLIFRYDFTSDFFSPPEATIPQDETLTLRLSQLSGNSYKSDDLSQISCSLLKIFPFFSDRINHLEVPGSSSNHTSIIIFMYCSYMCIHVKSLQLCSILYNPMDCSPRLLYPWDSPGKNTGVGCHVLLQGIFPTQGLNLSPFCLLHWQVDSLPLALLGKSLCSYNYCNASDHILRCEE